MHCDSFSNECISTSFTGFLRLLSMYFGHMLARYTLIVLYDTCIWLAKFSWLIEELLKIDSDGVFS